MEQIHLSYWRDGEGKILIALSVLWDAIVLRKNSGSRSNSTSLREDDLNNLTRLFNSGTEELNLIRGGYPRAR